MDAKRIRMCPMCGKEYSGYPALSRKDNKTEICSECGTREALEEYYESMKRRITDDNT